MKIIFFNILLLSVLILLPACSSITSEHEKKLDPLLHVALDDEVVNYGKKHFNCNVLLTQPLTQEMREELTKLGFEIFTSVDDVITVSAPGAAIMKSTELPYIKWIELSKKVKRNY